MFVSYVLSVRDLDVSRTFYRDTLSFGVPELEASEMVIFRLNDNSRLVLEQHDKVDNFVTGRFRLAIAVDELETAIQRCKEANIFVSEKMEFLGQPGCICTDPDGNAVLIYRQTK